MSECYYNYLPHRETHSFSNLIYDYLDNNPALKNFFEFTPNDEGLKNAIQQRVQFKTDRKILVDAINQQYAHIATKPIVRQHIDLIAHENTFTVTTAHQPNLMTGHLYFIYKILQTVKLCQHLKSLHPNCNFVPVYYMGSEDNDLDELGVFNYLGKDYRWQTPQTGAVGRMFTNDLQPLLNELYPTIKQSSENSESLKNSIQNAYERQPTIGKATLSLVNELFGDFGVVVVDPDVPSLKSLFSEIIFKEITQPVAYSLVSQTSEKLEKHYKAQAFARPINLFYLKDNVRERIEQKMGGGWRVLNHSHEWNNEQELKEEIEAYPDRFSPNVILRGLFQETILPNVAFIGGGSEVAYWMQLKDVFNHYHVFYPAIILRQSLLIEEKGAFNLQLKLGLSDNELFTPTEKLVKEYVIEHSAKDLLLTEEKLQISNILKKVKEKALNVEPTLANSTEAVLTKIKYQLSILEKKMAKAEKNNMTHQLNHIYKLKNQLFPNGSLQERYENFIPYYLKFGTDLFLLILAGTLPYGDQFLIIKEQNA